MKGFVLMKKYPALIVLWFLLIGGPVHGRASVGVELTKDKSAHFPVIIAEKSSVRVKDAAAELAVYLSKVSGAKFERRFGDGTKGIAVGLAGDFPLLGLAETLAVKTTADREAYILKSHKHGLYVVGATAPAVEHAVWDLLYRLGYRQFFPGETWEVIPHNDNIKIAIDVKERPDYLARRIWYGFGTWDYNAEPYAEWCRRNRATSGFVLKTSHAYESIIRRNQAVFDEHPEFLGLLDGERKSSKLCIGNPGLRKLVADHAVAHFADNPDADSISMDPSDGGGWCQCDKCAALGSISDRAITLANCVAEAVNEEFDAKYVGMYAYSRHSPPPNIRVHPNVIISVATSFIRGGYTLAELIAGWSERGASLGIREYYSVFPWDHDLPGGGRGSNLGYLRRTIGDFHGKGARFMSAESSDNWGPNGLGYYVASRILWDIDQADRVEQIVDDFLTRAFGPAAEPMTRFYDLIDGSKKRILCDDLIGRMYRQLRRAGQLTDDSRIRARINDLVLYTRYVELYHRYSTSKGRQRQVAFEELVRHGYRMRKTMMVHAKALYRDLDARDKSVSIPEGASWSVREEKNTWKSSKPFTAAELENYPGEGISTHKLRDFEPVHFSRNLVPAAGLRPAEVKADSATVTGRNTQTFYTWVREVSGSIELRITGGLITHYRDRGNVRVDLWKVHTQADGTQEEVKVSHAESAPDGVERLIRLEPKQTGLHKITVNDGGDRTRVAWGPDVPMTIISSLDEPAALSGSWNLCFYVPRGTSIVGLYADGGGTLLDSNGEVVFTFTGKEAGFHKIPVPKGADAGIWRFRSSTGTKRLMTVPPCLAPSPQQLLLPREVVNADSAGRR